MKYTYEIKDVSGRIVQTIKSESPLILEENKDKSVDLSKYRLPVYTSDIVKSGNLLLPSSLPLQVRIGGKYKDKGFWLSDNYNWEIKQDSECETWLVLVPTLK